MKNLRFLTICGATMLLVACTQDDVTTTASYEAYKAAQPTPIAFSTYMGEQATTRAEHTGAITNTTDLQGSGVGFGVFAYYTGNKLYPSTENGGENNASWGSGETALVPNFMYNQKVYYASSWTYEPLKYWPNEFSGNSDNQSATGTNNSYLSFFAYAPYASSSDISAAANTGGITGMSANDHNGDPTVTYTMASNTNNFVDLLWGVYNGTTMNVLGSGNSADKVTGGKANVNINLQKQKTGGSVGFMFKHALAKLENITIDAFADVVRSNTNTSSNQINETKITVKSVKIESTSNLPTVGTLNLATGVWNNLTTSAAWSIEFTSTSSPTNGLNTSIAEPSNISNFSSLPNGVPGKSSDTNFNAPSIASNFPLIVFFPDQRPQFKVTVEYVVRTEDTALAKGYSEVTQKISQTLQFANNFEMNKKYKIGIHLGLTSVKFTASVDSWDSTAVGQEVDLPINVSSN